MKTRIFMAFLAAILVVAISGCSVRLRGSAGEVEHKKEKKDEPVIGEHDRGDDHDNRDHEKGGPPPHAHGLLKIPRGHLPPPGQCRIWIPGTPPGRQPKAGDCGRLVREVPPGAWLVYRHPGDPDRLEVTVFDGKHVGIVVEIQIYDVVTGEFLGHEESTARK